MTCTHATTLYRLSATRESWAQVRSASEARIEEERLGTRHYRNGLCRWSAKREEEGLGSTIQGTLNTIILSVYQVAFNVIKNYFCVLDTCLRVFKALCFQVT